MADAQSPANSESTPPDEDLVLVAQTLKPYGLVGELKVKPASFDFDRHDSLHHVWFKKTRQSAAIALEVRGTRADAQHWYLKFKGYRTPESVAPFSGGMLMVLKQDRLAIPQDMIYISDVVGMQAVDPEGNAIGVVVEVMENAAQEIMVVRTPKAEMLVPWVKPFVQEIVSEERKVIMDIGSLRDIYGA